MEWSEAVLVQPLVATIAFEGCAAGHGRSCCCLLCKSEDRLWLGDTDRFSELKVRILIAQVDHNTS